MTTDLPAGRELDAAVESAVMGVVDPDDYGSDEPPRYSTDIAAAWLVVERMAEKWPDWSLSSEWVPHTTDRVWSVTWGFDGYGWHDVEAHTAPLAVCRAALAAMR